MSASSDNPLLIIPFLIFIFAMIANKLYNYILSIYQNFLGKDKKNYTLLQLGPDINLEPNSLPMGELKKLALENPDDKDFQFFYKHLCIFRYYIQRPIFILAGIVLVVVLALEFFNVI